MILIVLPIAVLAFWAGMVTQHRLERIHPRRPR